MNKNIKSIFFVTALILLLVGISAISAADASNDTSSIAQQDTVKEVNVEKVSDNTITDTTTKNIKKENENDMNFYVSDSDGSDDNDGSQETPFKTVEKAINKTKVGYTNNIYIKAGTYKGLGNTNLTVDGGKTINFIGDGIDETVFDGEARFDYNTGDPEDPIFFWGSSEHWIFYTNESGNWFMNITDGRGQINLKNLTVTQMYSKGAYNERSGYYGDSIDLYPTANIDNYGKLTVDNVLFDQNYGGVGSAIRNNNKATLTVNNSEFKKNQKSTSSGNEGIVYNNGTATILNSYFHDNYARWGTICNDKKITVINTTLERNEAYDGGSDFKYGAGIAYNTGGADFYNTYIINTDNTIINCTFKNVDQTSVFGIFGNLTLTGNKFINTTGVKIKDDDRYYNNTHLIENNTFDGFIESSLYKTLSNSEPVYFGFDFEKTTNLIVRNNEFNIQNGTVIKAQYGIIANNTINSQQNTSGIIVPYTSNISGVLIENNTLTANINITGRNDIVRNNKLIVPEEYGVIIGARAKNETVTDNYIIALNKYGNDAVTPSSSNTIENNQPTLSNENLYVSPEVTEAQTGTPENPTTLMDALSKVNNGQSIILLPGTTKVYNFTETINIKQDTVKEGTTNFKLVSLYDKTILTNNNNLMFDIGAFNITLENITITKTTRNTQRAELIKTSANMTFINANIHDNAYTTNNPLFTITNANITFINSTITGNKVAGIGATMANIVLNKGTINFIDNCYIANNNKMTAFIGGTSSTINIIGNNIFTNQSGVGNAGENMTIIGNNTFSNMRNVGSANNLLINGTNKFLNSNDANKYNILTASKYGIIEGENIFDNCTDLINGGTILITGNNIIKNCVSGSASALIKGEITIEGSNKFINNTVNSIINSGKNNINITGSNIFEKNNGNTIIKDSKIILIDGNNKFVNNSMNSLISNDPLITGMYFINNSINISNTIFEDNNITKDGIIYDQLNSKLYLNNNNFTRNTFTEGASLIKKSFEIVWAEINTYMGWGLSLEESLEVILIYDLTSIYNITNNQFIDNTFDTGAAIFVWNDTSELTTTNLYITNNIFKNIKSENETLNIPTNNITQIENNIYENCTIGLADFTISSELEGQNIPQNTPIPVTITAGLLHPEYYDANILDNTEYQIFINDENTINTTETEYTFTAEKYGTYNIYAYNPLFDTTSNNITFNVIKKDIIVEPITTTVGQTTNITARITVNDETMTDLSKGKVTFKVNGKTLKDSNGKVIYAKVVNGTATIENFEVPDTWKNDSTIQAVYSGSVECEKLTSEKTNITVNPKETTLTITPLDSVTPGQTTTLTATLSDNTINTGKIVFKINGKTLKDANGKVIYAKIVNGTVSVDYALPETYKAGNYTVTATFIASGYDKLVATETLTVTA